MILIFTCFKAPSRLQKSELTLCKYSSLSLMQLRPDDVWPVLVQVKVFLAHLVLFLLQRVFYFLSVTKAIFSYLWTTHTVLTWTGKQGAWMISCPIRSHSHCYGQRILKGGKKTTFFITFLLHYIRQTILKKRVEFLLKVSVITRGFSIQNVTAGSINIWRTVALGTITRSKRSGQDTFNLALMVWCSAKINF